MNTVYQFIHAQEVIARFMMNQFLRKLSDEDVKNVTICHDTLIIEFR